MKLRSLITETPNWPKDGINFLDITPILENPRAFIHCVNQFANYAKDNQVTSLVAVESRGFPFAAGIANEIRLPLVLARKPNKLPRPVYSHSYVTEYSTDTIEIKESAHVGNRPLIIDDLLATGGTANAVAELLKNNFNISQIFCGVVINLSFLPGAELLKQNQIELKCLETY
jgi:adenine phosphoribosyltransferase